MIEVGIYTATPTDWEARGVFLLTDDGQIEAHPAEGAENLFEMIRESPIPIGDKIYTAGEAPHEWMEHLPVQYRGSSLVATRIEEAAGTRSARAVIRSTCTVSTFLLRQRIGSTAISAEYSLIADEVSRPEGPVAS
jgi:hypothetical protein